MASSFSSHVPCVFYGQESIFADISKMETEFENWRDQPTYFVKKSYYF